VNIQAFSFQPFESREGRDTVVGLRFRYDPGLIQVLKDALRVAGETLYERNLGGWLPEHKAWFVERRAWRIVRQRLVEAGCVITGQPADEAPRPEAARPVRWEEVIRQWYRELVLRWHPDRGGGCDLWGVR
jgi:hypothetical protein